MINTDCTILYLLKVIETLKQELATDELTQVSSFRALIHRWERIEEISAIAVDVVGLGEINKQQGHHMGDLLLKQVSSSLRAVTRKGDSVYRRGGDEFVILLPCTSEDALKIKKRVENLPFNLYIGFASGTDVVTDIVAKAFKEVENQKNNHEVSAINNTRS